MAGQAAGKPQRQRKQYIDLLRVFSFGIIFLYHFTVYVRPLGTDEPLMVYMKGGGSMGNVAVFLFFMISGAMLMYRYQDAFDLKEYLKTRFVRIMIPFWLCYVVVFFYDFWMMREFPEGPLYQFVWTFLGMDGYFDYRITSFYRIGEWFLGCIILLYLLFPILRWCMKRNIHVTTGVLLILNLILYYNNFWGFFRILTEKNLLVAMFYFVLGAWVEHLYDRLNFPRKRLVFTGIACVLTAGGAFVMFRSPYVTILVETLGVYLLFMQLGGILRIGILRSVVMWISRNSYVLYLMHHVMICRVQNHFFGWHFSLKGVFCIGFLVALFLYLYVTVFNRLFERLLVALKLSGGKGGRQTAEKNG